LTGPNSIIRQITPTALRLRNSSCVKEEINSDGETVLQHNLLHEKIHTALARTIPTYAVTAQKNGRTPKAKESKITESTKKPTPSRVLVVLQTLTKKEA